MDPHLVSIITPCLNGESFIHRLLESVLRQTYKAIEMICVDDGSTDDTKTVILSYDEQFRKAGMSLHYLYQENKGQAAALNAGLKLARGEYLTWPDSDDFLADTSIEKKVRFLDAHPDYDMVRTNAYCVDDKYLAIKNCISVNPNRFKKNIFKDLYMDRTYVVPICYMIRMIAFRKAYPEGVIFESLEGQNWQILIPTASRSSCGYVDENLCFVVERRGSHSRANRSYEEQLERINGLEEILQHAFKHSVCDIDACIRDVAAKYAWKRLNLACENHDRDLVNSSCKTLRYNHELTLLNEIKFWIKCNRIFSRVIHLLKSLRRIKLNG